MRWIACVVAVTLIIMTVKVLKYLEAETFWPLMVSVACLVATNVLYTVCLRRGWFVRHLAQVGIYADLVILTSMLHYSGGIENPLSFAYIFHIIIGGILLDRRNCYATVIVASALYASLALAELAGFLDHYTLLFFPHPEVGEHELFHAAHQPIFVVSLVALQFMLMSLTAYFTTTIMERLRLEEKRALADRQRLERVVQATGAGLAVLDRELHPVWLNDKIESWLNLPGASDGDLVGRLEKWTGGKHGLAAQTFRDGTVRVVERELIDARGGKRYFQVTIAPLMDDAGRVYQVAELTQDVTERKMVETEMMHSAKMAALGFMAAGIAHEIGNPLASISMRLRLLGDTHDESFLKESIRLLQNQISRIGRIVHGVSQFARPAKHDWTACQINEVVAETVNVLQLHRLAKNCQIRIELDEQLPETMGVKDQLAQVFLNLGLNSLEAMPHGGTLTIRTYSNRGNIRIEFEDTGEGMNEEVRSKLFTPFFSTKNSGLGLGLCIAHNVVQAHGGRIEAESSPGAGSLLTVVLAIRTLQGPASGSVREATQ